MKKLDSASFDASITSGVVLVDFFANWCGPCKMLAPTLEELSKEREDIKFFQVDVDENGDLAGRYGIQSIPNLIIFKDGKAVDQIVGFVPKNEIITRLDAQK